MYQKLENSMGKMGEWIYYNPLIVVAIVIFLLFFPISHLSQVKFDTSNEGFLHEKDPVLLAYNEFRNQFGRDERILLAIKSENIFTLDFLENLKALHEELEERVPYLDEVTSLYNIRNTKGENEQLITDDLLQPFPLTQEDLKRIKKESMESDFYRNLLLSSNGKMTAVIIENDVYSYTGKDQADILENGFDDNDTKESPKEFLSDKENSEIVNIVYEIVEKYKQKGMEIYVAGSPAVVGILKTQMQKDMQKFTLVTFLIVVIFLFLLFRRISAVVYPLIVIVLSLMTTVGMMAWSDTAFKLPTQIVPSLLLAVSVGATVHILSIFFDRFDKTGDKKDSLVYTLSHSGLAIVMTGVTTAIGIGSFAGSEVAPISDMGIFASFGVIISLILTLTFLPALLSLTKLKPKTKKRGGKIYELMSILALFPIYYYKTIVIGSAVLAVVALTATLKIELSHNPLLWFAKDKDVRISTEIIDKQMNGTLTIEAVVDTGKENGWQDPVLVEKLNKMTERMEQYKDDYIHIGKVISLATIVKETNRALHNNDQNYYTIPKDKKLLAQELLLFENSGSDDLEDVVDSQFSKTRITIKVPWVDSVKAVEVLRYIKSELNETFNKQESVISGIVVLMVETFAHAVHSSVISYMIAFVLIALMMMFIMRSVSIGLLSMIPNLTPIVMGLFIMYVANIPLDMFTLLIGSIAIGLAVDDTIHFMHNFRRYYAVSGNISDAITKTFITTGKAMVITTIVLSLGFYAYMMANMVAVQNFGLLTGSVIVLALLADLLLAPALMIVAAKRGWIR